MRNFIIDTDTASDDAVAIVMMLRAKDIKVHAITCVAGNLPLHKTVRNALLSVQFAGTYKPPVYAGAAGPMFRQLEHAESCHGEDGFGNTFYPDAVQKVEKEHAVDKIIEIVKAAKEEIEILTLGPLTNIALAVILAPDVMKKVKRITAMGGQFKMMNDCTPNAEFNIWQDAEATKIVLESGIPITLCPLDICYGTTEIDRADREKLRSFHTEVGDFFIDCNACLLQYNIDCYGKDIISMPDPTAAAVVIAPDMVEEYRECHAEIEVKSPAGYGQLLYDFRHLSGKPINCTLITRINPARFKQLVFDTASY